MGRPKVGLALGGGYARGFSHVGVLQVLEEAKITIDCIAATSSGSIIGSLYAAGLSPDQILSRLDEAKWSDLVKFIFPVDGLISAKPLEDFLGAIIGNTDFAHLKIPFAAVATNLLTGERVILREGDVKRAVRASCSMPGVISPVPVSDHCLLVDGGLVDNVPVDVVRALGADIVIAVDLNNFIGINEHAANLIQIIMQSIEIMQREGMARKLEKADVVIRPELGDLSLFALNRAEEFVARGIQAAVAALPQIKATIDGRSSRVQV